MKDKPEKNQKCQSSLADLKLWEWVPGSKLRV